MPPFPKSSLLSGSQEQNNFQVSTVQLQTNKGRRFPLLSLLRETCILWLHLYVKYYAYACDPLTVILLLSHPIFSFRFSRILNARTSETSPAKEKYC